MATLEGPRGGAAFKVIRKQVSSSTFMALDQIGQKLKAARESQGLSLADIYQRTKIPINHLQSIDNGIADDLPEPVYVSGFIRRYAECVGLNGQALSDEYRSFVDGANGNGRHAKPQRSMMDQPIMVTVPHSRGVRIEQHGPGFFKTMGVSVFWIIAILGLITFLFWYNSNQNISQDTSPILSLRDQPNRFNNVGPTGATPQASTAAPAAPDQPTDSRITLIASQHVWVEVKSVATGDSLFTGYLEAGDRRDFQDSQGLRVRAGNGGSLSVEYQGKSETFGAKGKPLSREFLAKSPAAQTTADATETKPTTTTAAPRPIVKKVARKATGDSGTSSGSRYRRFESGGHSYIPGESLGGGRSVDVPLRYTEGRLDTD